MNRIKNILLLAYTALITIPALLQTKVETTAQLLARAEKASVLLKQDPNNIDAAQELLDSTAQLKKGKQIGASIKKIIEQSGFNNEEDLKNRVISSKTDELIKENPTIDRTDAENAVKAELDFEAQAAAVVNTSAPSAPARPATAQELQLIEESLNKFKELSKEVNVIIHEAKALIPYGGFLGLGTNNPKTDQIKEGIKKINTIVNAIDAAQNDNIVLNKQLANNLLEQRVSQENDNRIKIVEQVLNSKTELDSLKQQLGDALKKKAPELKPVEVDPEFTNRKIFAIKELELIKVSEFITLQQQRDNLIESLKACQEEAAFKNLIIEKNALLKKYDGIEDLKAVTTFFTTFNNANTNDPQLVQANNQIYQESKKAALSIINQFINDTITYGEAKNKLEEFVKNYKENISLQAENQSKPIPQAPPEENFKIFNEIVELTAELTKNYNDVIKHVNDLLKQPVKQNEITAQVETINDKLDNVLKKVKGLMSQKETLINKISNIKNDESRAKQLESIKKITKLETSLNENVKKLTDTRDKLQKTLPSSSDQLKKDIDTLNKNFQKDFRQHEFKNFVIEKRIDEALEKINKNSTTYAENKNIIDELLNKQKNITEAVQKALRTGDTLGTYNALEYKDKTRYDEVLTTAIAQFDDYANDKEDLHAALKKFNDFTKLTKDKDEALFQIKKHTKAIIDLYDKKLQLLKNIKANTAAGFLSAARAPNQQEENSIKSIDDEEDKETINLKNAIDGAFNKGYITKEEQETFFQINIDSLSEEIKKIQAELDVRRQQKSGGAALPIPQKQPVAENVTNYVTYTNLEQFEKESARLLRELQIVQGQTAKDTKRDQLKPQAESLYNTLLGSNFFTKNKFESITILKNLNTKFKLGKKELN